MIEIKFVKEENRAIAYIQEMEIGECKFIENQEEWNIVHTFVNSNYQGQGIARKLVECIIEKSKEYKKILKADCTYAKKVLD